MYFIIKTTLLIGFQTISNQVFCLFNIHYQCVIKLLGKLVV